MCDWDLLESPLFGGLKPENQPTERLLERRGFLPSEPDDTDAAPDNVEGGPRRQEHWLNETAPRYGDSRTGCLEERVQHPE